MNPSDVQAMRDPAAGARNLLIGCAGVRPGDSVLIVIEPAGSTHYDPALAPFIADQARRLGAHVEIMSAIPAAGPESAPPALMSALGSADHTIFLNRIGDQLRFAPLPGTGTKTMSYTLDMALLGSEFAATPHRVWEGIQTRLTAQLDAAHRYSIRCPKGTDLSMRLDDSRIAQQRTCGFTVKNFPVMIVPPIPASGLSGKLVLSQALTSTYVHSYDDSIVPLPSPLTLHVADGEIVRIEGDDALVARAETQFRRVGAMFGGSTWALNSWHAGINAFTSFPRPALTDIDRWSCVAFGSPRYAHFHMCGSSPGDICGQIFDPTITFDDCVLWEGGYPLFLSEQEQHSLLAQSDIPPDTFRRHRDIGI